MELCEIETSLIYKECSSPAGDFRETPSQNQTLTKTKQNKNLKS